MSDSLVGRVDVHADQLDLVLGQIEKELLDRFHATAFSPLSRLSASQAAK